MAATINTAAYSDALVVLGTAGIVVPIVSRLGFSPVLGYLGAGALLGPLGLGSFVNSLPVLFWFTVSDAKNVEGIAELGIVFLLFLIGLELSLDRLLTMRRLVFGLGGLQVLLATAVLAAAAAMAGQSASTSLILGASLSLSSTAIVLELLSRQERLTTNVGRASFSVLLAQDLAVIPILLFISILAAGPGGSVLKSLGIALLQAAVAVGVIVVFGRLLLRPLFRLVAATHSRELFIAAALFVIVGDGVIASRAGMSMALGAFVAGLLLAETEYRKAIEATIEPFKGLLLGHLFLHRRHGDRLSRAMARAAVARRQCCRLDRRQIDPGDRSGEAVPSVMAGRGRNRAVARSGRGIRVRWHRHGDSRGTDRGACVELHACRHVGHHGADAAAVIRRPAVRVADYAAAKPLTLN